MFIYAAAIRLRLLPGGALFGSGGGAVRWVLPALLLSLFPALVTSQAALRVLSEPGPRGRRLARAALAGLGTLLTQTGGLLSVLVPLEVMLAWPGLGRALVQALSQRDLPVFAGILLLFVGLVLVARLIAEAFFALARLVSDPPADEVLGSSTPEPRRRARLVVGLALLLVPLAIVVAGLATPLERVMEFSPADRNQGPSADHPWGTDSLGRDLQARVLRGALTTIGLSLGAGLLAALPAVLLGALTSGLARRRQLAPESLADLLLLPTDAWLLVPGLLAALVVILLFPGSGGAVVMIAAALALFPRAARAAHTVWTAAPVGLPRARSLAAGFAGVFLAAVWAGLWLVTALEFVGFGVRPPTPSLGGLLTEGLATAAQQPAALVAPSLVVWLCAVALYAAAVAILGILWGKASAGWYNA
jgi:peptide/nickel transport system permease protein